MRREKVSMQCLKIAIRTIVSLLYSMFLLLLMKFQFVLYLCGEFGKNKEFWFKCNECASWALSACADWSQLMVIRMEKMPRNQEKRGIETAFILIKSIMLF